MDGFAKLKPADRQPYFQEAAARRNLTITSVEKDFWVCWTLRHLFSLKDIPELRFKGGTSLSKVFALIERFSEDIDISIDRAALGFVGERDLANPDLSVTRRKALGKELAESITKVVTTRICPLLRDRFREILGGRGWKLSPSEQKNEEMTILFKYPSEIEYGGYLQPEIKIEFGRGDQQPSEKLPVTPIVTEVFPEVFVDKTATVAVLDSQRTFWEKITLLHSENNRPDPTELKPYMARHWSDIAVMSTAERFKNGGLSLGLLRQVIEFKQIYFERSWAHYETAFPSTLKIVPSEPLQEILKKDYQQMGEMFPRKRLSFDEILERLRVLENRINILGPAPKYDGAVFV